MSSFSRVLMATDLSRQSANMTDGLTSFCPDGDTSIVLAHVFEDEDDAEPRGSRFNEITSKLENYRQQLLQEGYHDIKIVTTKGDPAEEIHKLTEANDADLIFVASHGKGFIRSAIMGTSTTYDLARESLQPLFIDKDDADAKENLLSSVLVATDFSKKSLQVLNIIRELHDKVERCLFVHVIENDESNEDAETFLQELTDEMKMFGIPSEFKIAKGVASREIIQIAEQEKCQIITMAKTGAGNCQDDPLGSTSKALLLNAECALLLMPDIDDEE
ncbi:MAG: universal stress protein [Phascolarctobacterium sp.]|nr:universal stress protein [Candidatus Phascolarctobacterium caballi]